MTAGAAALLVALAYAIGSAPVPYLTGRLLGGVDLRERGSGNVGASNVWQSVSKTAVVPVGIAQIGQGLAAVLIARALGSSGGTQVAAGLAAVLAHQWNPWLRLRGGRGIGPAIGIMLALSWPVLACFAAITLAGVLLRRVPELMLAAIVSMPLVALVADEPTATTAGVAILAVLLVAKRVAGNAFPAATAPRPAVWTNRLLHDRDVRDRDAWVRRSRVLSDESKPPSVQPPASSL